MKEETAVLAFIGALEAGLLVLLGLFVLTVAAHAQLPNRNITPGVIRTSDSAEICAKTFRTKPFRHTTLAMKHQACAAYGITDECPSRTGKMELDHLVPLELGGDDSIDNLWPQLLAYPDGSPGFQIKDRLENELKKQVCAGTITLPDAQACIASNWTACFVRIFRKQITHTLAP